ncbi:MAG: penicillin-binding protein 2 [Lachnospiraceae bacterium]|nr:penicillin-binding protein 2 [Lachnospiraceae bacterium]
MKKNDDSSLSDIEKGLEKELYRALVIEDEPYDEERHENESYEDESYEPYEAGAYEDELYDDGAYDESYDEPEPVEDTGKKPKKRRSINREYMIVSYTFVALFLFLSAYIIKYIAIDAESFIGNSYNRRITEFSPSVQRGDILTSDGLVVAYSSLDDEQNETRVYPEGELYAHSIGYSTKGMSGVELDANYTLLRSHMDVAAQAKATIEGKKVHGDNVYTTLDSNLQECAYRNLGNYNGAVLAMDPKSGEILAMVSRPSFDPNEIADIWDEIVNDPDSSVLLNRATQGLYPPGSTFKIVTGLEYLAEGGSVSDDFYCEGMLTKDDYTIHCFNSTAHGSEDFMSAFATSCNVAFSEMGLSLDRDKYTKKAEELLFNTTLPTDLSNVQKSSFDIEDASDALIMQTAIGQGNTLMTPIHLAMIASAATNDGLAVRPYIIDRVENADGVLVKKNHPGSATRIMSEDEAATLKQMLRAVITDNYTDRFENENYTAYGKTGTAEYTVNKDITHSWFVGLAENDDKQLAVVVIMEEAGTGGQFSLPLAKRVFDEYF